MKKLTTKEFINKAILKHGYKYGYSKVEYINASTNIIIICPIHGDFLQQPNNHLTGRGCPQCTYNCQKLSFEEFIKKSTLIHGDKYDYSKVIYTGNKNKVIIICKEHGEFLQKPNGHMYGKGCRKCANNLIKNKKIKTTESFIKDAIKVHGNNYDYSKVIYTGNKNKVTVICKIHGEFMVTPNSHISLKSGCKKCYNVTLANRMRKDKESFIASANKMHNNKYDYSQVEYYHSKNKVKICCPSHKEFMQTPNSHLRGNGCPACNESSGERKIENFLLSHNINHIRQARFSECRGRKYPLPFDFYLPDYNICIEYDGEQHSNIDSKWHSSTIPINDGIKTKFCKDKGINLIRIPYFDFEQINKILCKSLSIAI